MPPVYVVVGGARGIGRAAVPLLARLGTAKVIVLDKSLPEPDSQEHVWLSVDVTDDGAVSRAFRDVCAKASIGGLLYTAGVLRTCRLGQESPTVLGGAVALVEVNLLGALRTLHYAAPFLADGAAVVVMGSSSSLSGFSGLAAYCASKFGLVGLVQSAAKEFAARGITINLLCPSALEPGETDMATYQRELFLQGTAPGTDYPSMMVSRQPVKRLCRVADVLPWIEFLMGPVRPAYFTGQCVSLTGGGIMLH